MIGALMMAFLLAHFGAGWLWWLGYGVCCAYEFANYVNEK